MLANSSDPVISASLPPQPTAAADTDFLLLTRLGRRPVALCQPGRFGIRLA